MVDVRMGADDRLDCQPVPPEQFQDAVNFVSRIDDQRFPAKRIPDYRAIALQHPHGDGDVDQSL
jgi:hypothetical protein